MSNLLGKTFQNSIDLLRKNSTRLGFKASSSYYRQVWARDAFITALGGVLLDDPIVLKTIENSLRTLGRSRSPLGQIADCFDPHTRRAEFGVSGATDASSWYIIGLASAYQTLGWRRLLDEPLDAGIHAYKWLRHQDANDTWLIDSPPGADWMDAAVRRAGKTLYNNILFLIATRAINWRCNRSGRKLDRPYPLDATKLEQRFLQVFHPGKSTWRDIATYWPHFANKMQGKSFAEMDYFAHYVAFSVVDTHFDTLSNLLCILSGVAKPKFAERILSFISANKLSRPYPVRVLEPAYVEGEAPFDSEFNKSLPEWHRSDPYHYQNGAIWPFVGGFYVMALIERSKNAEGELSRLAEANCLMRVGDSLGFNEWLHGKTGQPMGQDGQSWNAGMFIAACLYKKGVTRFQFE
jgi:glycogen debranching enzyme